MTFKLRSFKSGNAVTGKLIATPLTKQVDAHHTSARLGEP
jgi:hypothetical protein